MSIEKPVIKNRVLYVLFEEYKRVVTNYINVSAPLSMNNFSLIRDRITQDPDCVSIQTVVLHTIRSGYIYANYLNKINNIAWEEYKEQDLHVNDVFREFEMMMDFTALALSKFKETDIDIVNVKKINARWNVTYDVEQLMEHAIVHIMRHRRQIESFLAK